MTAYRISAAFLSLLIAPTVAAWDGIATFSPALPVDFAPAAISTPDAHGFWSAGTSDGFTVLVRYDPSGVFQYLRYSRVDGGATISDLQAMPDGGVLISDTEGSSGGYCVLRRYDVSGYLRWSSGPLFPPLPHYSYNQCLPLAVDGGGGIWLLGNDTLTRIGADGAVQSTFALGDLFLETFVGDPDGGAVYAIGAIGGSDTGLATIEKIDEHGTLLWTVQAPGALGHSDFRDAAADNAGIYAFGKILHDSAPDTLYGIHLSAAGKPLWQVTNSGIAARSIDAVAVAGDGSGIVLFESSDPGSDGAQIIAKTGAAGAFAWSATTRARECYSYALQGAPNGDVVVGDALCPDLNNTQDSGELIRFTPGGARIADAPLSGDNGLDMQVLADSSSVLLDPSDPALGRAPMLERRGRDGAALAPPPTAHLVTGLHDPVDSAMAPDGSVYLLDQPSGVSGFALTHIAPNGQVLWTRQGNGGWYSDPYGSTVIVVADGAVCLVGLHDGGEVGECHAADTGEPLGTAQLDPAVGNHATSSSARAVGNGHILEFYTNSDGKTHETLFSTNGSILSDATPLQYGEYLEAISINAAGLTLIATEDSSYVELAADGTRRYSQSSSGVGAIYQVYLLDDGTGLLLSKKGTSLQLSRIDAHGAVVWTKVVPQPTDGSPPYNHVSTIVINGGDAYLAFGYSSLVQIIEGEPLRHHPYLVERLLLSDGSVSWDRVVDSALLNLPLAQLDSSAQRLVTVSAWSDKLRTQVLDAGSGAVIDDRFDACGASDCTLLRSAIGSDGVLRAVVSASDESGRFERVFRRSAPFAAPATIRMDQAGIDGAWFSPYASGQGFTLDYIPSAKTLFMPWFTYTTNGGNAPDGLAWYALQGTADAGATSSDLAITTPDPGAFANGAVGVRAVGSARLSFTDCNSGSLSYQFDADVNGGAAGLISLTRLTPSSSACVLADGSVVPAQETTPPAQGFDANQSGSWFDPGTSGQGLEITVQPPGASSNGLLFAAWFTFDPANNSDDDAHRHWFTLQGDLSGASAGKATVSILRTIGGTLDGTPTGNTLRVGQATLTFKACDSAQLDYQFDRSDVAHAFAGLSGSNMLSKIGGCTAQ